MILDIDVGNTRIKWRFCDSLGNVVSRGFSVSASIDSGDAFNKLFDIKLMSPLSVVRVAAVASDFNEYISRWASDHGADLYFAETQSSSAGVSNAYQQVSHMGVDRWLAMIAAYQKWLAMRTTIPDLHRALIVIDAGSALTLDIITSGGQHLGGYIVPGLAMMHNALLGNTERVRFAENSSNNYPDDLCLGDSTKRAVLSGAPMMQLGFIQRVITTTVANQKNPSQEDVAIFITGGDAAYLSSFLRQDGIADIHHYPDLVMDGLALCLD
ncbi:type III pantothenate kinase [Eionea flava]